MKTNKKVFINKREHLIFTSVFCFQISDWLNLDQNMAKNYHVDVSDIEAITEAINKQKVRVFVFIVKNDSYSKYIYNS